MALGSLVASALPNLTGEPGTSHFGCELGTCRCWRAAGPQRQRVLTGTVVRGRQVFLHALPSGRGRTRAALVTLGTQTQDPETDTRDLLTDTHVPGSEQVATQNTAHTELPQSESETRPLLEPRGPHPRAFRDVCISSFPETSTKVKIQG